MLRDWLIRTSIFSTIISSPYAFADQVKTPVFNFRDMQKAMGVDPSHYPIESTKAAADSYTPDFFLRDVRVAVLDTGFNGWEEAKSRKLLPASAENLSSLAPIKNLQGTDHGTKTAQKIWAMTAMHPAGPHLMGLNATGLDNLEDSLTWVGKNQIDAVVYSHTSNFGTFGDGQGFVNAIFQKHITSWQARAANDPTFTPPVIFVSAGNNGGLTYQGRVDIDNNTGFVKFPGSLDNNIFPFEVMVDESPVKISLTWSDRVGVPGNYTDRYNNRKHLSKKDLNLFLYDAETKKLINQSNFRQAGRNEDLNFEEIQGVEIAAEGPRFLPRGKYYLQIQEASEGTDEEQDENGKITRVKFPRPEKFSEADVFDLRFEGAVQMEYKNLVAGENRGPSDLPSVITIGNSFPHSASGIVALNGSGRSITKPDFKVPSSAVPVLSNGQAQQGTTDSNDLMVGTYVMMLQRVRHLNFLGKAGGTNSIHAETLQAYAKTLRRDQGISSAKAPIWRAPSPEEIGELENQLHSNIRRDYAKASPKKSKIEEEDAKYLEAPIPEAKAIVEEEKPEAPPIPGLNFRK